MSDQPFVGRWYLELGLGGSPEAYERFCAVSNVTGIGETNELVDVTTACSNGSREFIGGLAEGSEVTIEANFIVDDLNRERMIADVKNKTNRSFRLVFDDNGDGATDLTLWFRSAPIAWELIPSIEDKNQITFVVKISGGIDITKP